MIVQLGSMVVGPIELAEPAWLVVGLCAVWLVVLVGRRSLSSGGSGSRRAAVLVRVVVTMVLAGALAEPSLRDESDKLAVTAVLDMSRSVPSAAQAQAEAFVEAAAASGRRERVDLLGTVTAAQEAYVQSLPSALASAVESQTIGSTDGTNLEEALRLALAVRPADAAQRLVLISDGNETEGSLLAAAESARAMGVPVDVLPLSYRYPSEVVLEGVDTPASARLGEIINARVTLRSTARTRGRLMILAGGEPLAIGEAGNFGFPVELEAGVNTILVPLGLSRRGPQEIEAAFEPLEVGVDDAIAENNRGSSITFFSGEGRVLVLADRPEESVRLTRALEDGRIGYDTAAPDGGPASLVEFNAYDAVILCNLPAYSFSEQQLAALKSYVEDSGGGLVMMGGPESFGAGGWIGTPVEEILPVQLDPPQTRRMPRGALALVMHSVEVPEGVFYGQQTAQAASDALSRLDLVGVIEFNWQSGAVKWVHPLATRGDGSAVSQSIKQLTFGDMPDMAPSVQLAYEGLVAADAGQKHAIIISDGDPSPPGRSLLQKFVDAGITISTVGVFPHGGGPGSPDLLRMREIAEFTGGRYYGVTQSRQLATLPQIFIKEAQTVKRALIWEGQPFSPALTGMPSEPFRGVSAVPAITGYVVTADRTDGLAVVTLRGPENDPVLAHWQRGLGRVTAFTSDVTTRWAEAWTTWAGYDSFWAEHVRWTMRPSGNAEARTRIETDGDTSTLIVDLADAEGTRINFARIAGRVSDPSGRARDLSLRQDGPGRYVASFPTPDPGAYVVGLRYDAPGQEGRARTEGSVQAAVTRPFADEFRDLQDNAGLLRQIAERTGGRVLSPDPALANLWDREGLERPVSREPMLLAAIIIMLALFLLDVAVRRVRLDVALLRGLVAKATGRAVQTAGANVDSLRRARERAQSRIAGGAESASARQAAKAAAARKFEAAPGASAAIDLGTQPSAEIRQQGAPKAAEASPGTPLAGEGLSRLLQAKKRAQDEMTDE